VSDKIVLCHIYCNDKFDDQCLLRIKSDNKQNLRDQLLSLSCSRFFEKDSPSLEFSVSLHEQYANKDGVISIRVAQVCDESKLGSWKPRCREFKVLVLDLTIWFYINGEFDSSVVATVSGNSIEQLSDSISLRSKKTKSNKIKFSKDVSELTDFTPVVMSFGQSSKNSEKK
jgi:hypothetical protein